MKEQAEELQKKLSHYKSLLIPVKGSPDPDALASAFALKVLAEGLSLSATITATAPLSLPQNKAFVSHLKIPLHISGDHPDPENYDAYAIVDHQSADVPGITGTIPCAAHIDHHEKIEEEIPCDLKIIREDAGSASTIMALIFREIKPDIKPALQEAVSTALLYGIQTDTDKYRHAKTYDYEAINYLSKYANNRIINKITGLPMSEKTALLLVKAVENQETYRDWLITGVGFIDEEHRDSIAIIADFLLARHQQSVVFVYAIIEGEKKSKERLRLDVSIRTDDDEMPLNDIIKAITTNGGGRRYKGAWQVDLDYFHTMTEEKRALLWETIREATFAAIKHQRDTYTRRRIRGAFFRFIDRIRQ